MTLKLHLPPKLYMMQSTPKIVYWPTASISGARTRPKSVGHGELFSLQTLALSKVDKAQGSAQLQLELSLKLHASNCKQFHRILHCDGA